MDISGSVSLDSKLADCTVGQEKQIILTVVPTKNDDTGFQADVKGLEEYDDESQDFPPDSADQEEPDSPPQEKLGKNHMIIAIGLGGPKKPKGQ